MHSAKCKTSGDQVYVFWLSYKKTHNSAKYLMKVIYYHSLYLSGGPLCRIPESKIQKSEKTLRWKRQNIHFLPPSWIERSFEQRAWAIKTGDVSKITFSYRDEWGEEFIDQGKMAAVDTLFRQLEKALYSVWSGCLGFGKEV